MKFLIRIILPAILFSQFALAQRQETRIVYLVRHAEKASNADDSPLSTAGQKRADCLARTLKEAGIKQIYVTDTKRTQQTAAPLAAALKITPQVIPARDPNTLIRDLLYAGGGNILVVGHSDTIPFVLARLKAGTVARIADNEYDRLFVTTVIEGGATQASTLRYCDCAPGPAAAPTPSTKTGKKTTPTKKK